MNSDLINSILLFFPALIYFLIWYKIKDLASNSPQLILWIFFTIALFSIGFLTYEKKHYNEISSIGNGFLYTSSIILLGPGLLLMKSSFKKSKVISTIFSLVFFPLLGFFFTSFALLFSGQITGT